jgi:hypothetical protein
VSCYWRHRSRFTAGKPPNERPGRRFSLSDGRNRRGAFAARPAQGWRHFPRRSSLRRDKTGIPETRAGVPETGRRPAAASPMGAPRSLPFKAAEPRIKARVKPGRPGLKRRALAAASPAAQTVLRLAAAKRPIGALVVHRQVRRLAANWSQQSRIIWPGSLNNPASVSQLRQR